MIIPAWQIGPADDVIEHYTPWDMMDCMNWYVTLPQNMTDDMYSYSDSLL